MITRIHQKLGTAGFVISIVALVAALGGGAYAAKGALTSKQKKEVEKIAKKYAGKAGATGAAGPAGGAGSTGPQGTAGTKGDPGSPGSPGSPGAGATVESFTGTRGACTGGGATVKGASGEANVCNGREGQKGKEGSPWPPGTLPGNATLTGIWGTAGNSEPEGRKSFPVSFPLPLSMAPSVAIVGPTEEKTAECPGRGGGSFPPTGEFEPTIPEAEPGVLCVYVDIDENATISGVSHAAFEEGFGWFMNPGPNQTGGILAVNCTAACAVNGTWAVTGPEE